MSKTSVILTHLASAGVLCLTFSACTVTETIKDGLGTTKDFLSSTTPGSWVTGDGLLKTDQKVNAFVTLNFENLKQDMAQGHGEYLASLSELFGVPPDRKAAFFSHAQSRYRSANAGRRGPSELIALLASDPSDLPRP